MQWVMKIPQMDTFSDDELFELCQANPELRIERDEYGRIIIMPPTGLETSFRNSDLNTEVNNWNRRKKLGRVSDSNGGYNLPDTSMRAPDVAFVSHERLATISAEDIKKFAPICPDFVIELLSESDDLKELQEKMQKWIKNGVRLAWLVNPKEQQTFIYRPKREREEKPFSETLSGEEVLPDFTVNLDSLFS